MRSSGAALATLAGGRGGRAGRYAVSELVLATALGADGWRTARRLGVDGRAQQTRHDLYRDYWSDAAGAVGATLEDQGGGLLRLSAHGRTVSVWDNLVPLDDPVSLRLAGDRGRSHSALDAAGLRVPQHAVFAASELPAASGFLADVGACVVKPASSTGAGTAVTCGVRTRDELRAAVGYAARWGERVILEQQAGGAEHRILVLDGEVIGTVRRQPPSLVGDGVSTVAELVEQENLRRRAAHGRAGLFPLTLDLDLVATQRRAGRRLTSVVRDGVAFDVKTAVNENAPAQNQGLSSTPDALADVAARAVAAVGLRLGAVELVVPPDGSAPTVLEVNSTPGLHYHYQVAEDSPVVPVARPLLTTLLLPDRSSREARPS